MRDTVLSGDEGRPVVIVGSGLAAVSALEGMREAGYSGPVVMIGEERQMPYDRPPLSKMVLSEIGAEDRIFLREQSAYDALGATMLLGRSVTGIASGKREVTLDDGTRLPYEKLLLATGSRPRILQGLSPSDPGVFYLRTLDDSIALRAALKDARSLVVIGGGVIGLEVAAVAIKADVSTTVIEAGSRLMARAAAPQLSVVLEKVHRENGVNVLCGAAPTGFAFFNNQHAISMADGTVLEADLLVVGIGVIPETSLASAAGIECGPAGIVVDGVGATNVEHIYAAGEVAHHFNAGSGSHERQENWHHAAAHGKHIGMSMIAPADAYREISGYWSDQYDLNVQVFGSVAGDKDVVRGDIDAKSFSVFHLLNETVIGVTAVNAPRELRAGKQLVRSKGQLSN